MCEFLSLSLSNIKEIRDNIIRCTSQNFKRKNLLIYSHSKAFVIYSFICLYELQSISDVICHIVNTREVSRIACLWAVLDPNGRLNVFKSSVFKVVNKIFFIYYNNAKYVLNWIEIWRIWR